jgi:hypothetical protein
MRLLLLLLPLSLHLAPLIYGHTYTHTPDVYVCIYPLSARMGYILGKIFFLFSPKRPKKKKETKKFLYKFEKFVERLIEIIALLGEMLEAAQQVLGKNGHGTSKRFRVTTLRF